MVHRCFKWLIRQALHIFFSKVVVQPQSTLQAKGPLLLVANHPNSFLDAIVIGACFSEPVHFLARGDAFERPVFRFLLGALNTIPIYRLREGRDQVRRNRDSFAACQQVLDQGKILLIFIEGICVNSHQLQPFKKGAARLALEYRGVAPLQVLPVGIAFEHLRGMNKGVHLCLGAVQPALGLLHGTTIHQQVQLFNQALWVQLEELIDQPAPQQKEHWLRSTIHPVVRFFNWPCWILCSTLSAAFTRGTVFYDSVLFALLFLGYPLYLLAWLALWHYLGLSFGLAFVLLLVQVGWLVVGRRPGFLR